MIASPQNVNFAFMKDDEVSKGDSLAKIIKNRDIRPADLARATGVSPQTVNNWLKRGVSTEYALLAADFLVCNPAAISSIQPTAVKPKHLFLTNNETSEIGMGLGKVPLISGIQAGHWCEAIDNFQPGDAEEWLPAPTKHGPHAYALRVTGTSMEPRLREGEIVVVDPDRAAESGSIVVARKAENKEVTLKQLIREGGDTYLKAINPHWPEPIIRLSEEWTVCGRVICKIEIF